MAHIAITATTDSLELAKSLTRVKQETCSLAYDINQLISKAKRERRIVVEIISLFSGKEVEITVMP